MGLKLRDQRTEDPSPACWGAVCTPMGKAVSGAGVTVQEAVCYSCRGNQLCHPTGSFLSVGNCGEGSYYKQQHCIGKGFQYKVDLKEAKVLQWHNCVVDNTSTNHYSYPAGLRSCSSYRTEVSKSMAGIIHYF